jgi:hypothetical protein
MIRCQLMRLLLAVFAIRRAIDTPLPKRFLDFFPLRGREIVDWRQPFACPAHRSLGLKYFWMQLHSFSSPRIHLRSSLFLGCQSFVTMLEIAYSVTRAFFLWICFSYGLRPRYCLWAVFSSVLTALRAFFFEIGQIGCLLACRFFFPASRPCFSSFCTDLFAVGLSVSAIVDACLFAALFLASQLLPRQYLFVMLQVIPLCRRQAIIRSFDRHRATLYQRGTRDRGSPAGGKPAPVSNPVRPSYRGLDYTTICGGIKGLWQAIPC